MIDARRPGQRATAHRIVDDVLGGILVVAEYAKRFGHHAVDDLEIAATGELLELD